MASIRALFILVNFSSRSFKSQISLLSNSIRVRQFIQVVILLLKQLMNLVLSRNNYPIVKEIKNTEQDQQQINKPSSLLNYEEKETNQLINIIYHYKMNIKSIIINRVYLQNLIRSMIRRQAFCEMSTSTDLNDSFDWIEPQVLGQKNTNFQNIMNSTIYKSNLKRNYNKRKALNLKFQKHQANNKNINFMTEHVQVSLKQNQQNLEQKKTSNIQFLKKQIQYLQQNQNDYDQFPTEKTLLKNIGLTQFDTRPRATHFDFQSIGNNSLKQNRISALIRSTLIPSPQSSYSKCFFMTPLNQRPFTSADKKSIKKSFLSLKKAKGKSMAGKSQIEKQNLVKVSQSKFELIAPYRKYFQTNRSKRNNSCTLKVDVILGKKLQKLTSFQLQDID